MPTISLSEAVGRIQPSATIAAAQKAKALKATGQTVYEFTLGEPDFTTPEHIREAAKAAMDAGHTHYTPAGGLPALKEAICAAYKRETGITYEPSQCLASNGAKHAIHNVLTALVGPGDEVIIATPYWVSYSELVALTGATPVFVSASEENGWVLEPEALAAAVTPKTRLVMLNSPSNPTGAVYPEETLAALGRIIVEKDILLLSDEIYDKLIYSGHGFTSFATLGEDVRERTILINGVSKAFAMTGWRIGWTLGPAELIKAMNKLQSQETSNPCSISQFAAIAALEGPRDCVESMRAEFEKRREYVLGRLRKFPQVSFAEPGGAFYAFLNVSRHFNRPLGSSGRSVDTSSDFCTILLEDAKVGVVTGDAFGAPGYVRLSFATDGETLRLGLDRFEEFFQA